MCWCRLGTMCTARRVGAVCSRRVWLRHALKMGFGSGTLQFCHRRLSMVKSVYRPWKDHYSRGAFSLWQTRLKPELSVSCGSRLIGMVSDDDGEEERCWGGVLRRADGLLHDCSVASDTASWTQVGEVAGRGREPEERSSKSCDGECQHRKPDSHSDDFSSLNIEPTPLTSACSREKCPLWEEGRF